MPRCLHSLAAEPSTLWHSTVATNTEAVPWLWCTSKNPGSPPLKRLDIELKFGSQSRAGWSPHFGTWGDGKKNSIFNKEKKNLYKYLKATPLFNHWTSTMWSNYHEKLWIDGSKVILFFLFLAANAAASRGEQQVSVEPTLFQLFQLVQLVDFCLKYISRPSRQTLWR